MSFALARNISRAKPRSQRASWLKLLSLSRRCGRWLQPQKTCSSTPRFSEDRFGCDWDSGMKPKGDSRRLSNGPSSKDRHRHALALNNLGMGRLIRSRYDEALLWFEQVLSYTDLEQMAVYGTALYNAGICYSRLGEFDRALAVQHRAAQFHERSGPSRQLVESLGSLGITYGLRNEPHKALPFLQRALEAATKANLPGDAALWAGNLATAHAELGNWNESERFNEQAKRLGTGGRTVKPVYFTLNAAQIAAGRGDLEKAEALYESALKESEGAAAVSWSAQAGLARVAIAARSHDSLLSTSRRPSRPSRRPVPIC